MARPPLIGRFDWSWLVVLVSVLLAIGPLHPLVERSSYGADRAVITDFTQVSLVHQGYGTYVNGPVIVYYPPDAAAQARSVAANAAWALPKVATALGLPKPSRVVMVVENSEAALRASMGWGPAEQALGVYWNGVVRVLNPTLEELPGPPGTLDSRYWHNGPVAHELTHLVLDLATNGNYPAWYTEGLAQYVDYEITGYPLEPAGLSPFIPPYGYGPLLRQFYALPGTDAAYAEAFRMILTLTGRYGAASIPAIDHGLASGLPLPQALVQAVGLTPEALFRQTFP